tara:strand:- start:113 stop:607 length:495 start_codon:yes stop_codon:yes gene_type:complete
MWSMKKKGDKPHYKPGTDKKYKKYQEESLSVKDSKKLKKASVLDQSKDPKDWDSARARRTEIDYKDLMRQIKAKKKMRNEATTMKDNNLFGNAYAGDKDWKKKNKKAMAHRYKTLHKGDSGGDVNESDDYEKLKKKIGSKKKHDKPAIKEGISYKDFMRNVYID